MCDVGYFCANFSLPIGLSVLELSPMYATDRKTDVRRQTDVRQKCRLMLPPYGGGGIIMAELAPMQTVHGETRAP